MSKYGECPRCGSELHPIWFTEDEYKTTGEWQYKTGRKRTSCSHLECPDCGQKECVDDTFDGNWR
jgi:predicted nucleic-acid-binding Zn-ribbon protein